MRGETNPPGGHSRDVWARRVVSDLLKSSPSPYVCRGFIAIILWLVSIWVPTWLIDYAFRQTADLGKLKKMVQEQEKAKSQS